MMPYGGQMGGGFGQMGGYGSGFRQSPQQQQQQGFPWQNFGPQRQHGPPNYGPMSQNYGMAQRGGYGGFPQQGYGGASLSRQGYGQQMGMYGGMNYGGPSFGFGRQTQQPQSPASQGFAAGADASPAQAAFSQRMGQINPDAQWNPTAGAGGGYWTKKAGSTLDDAEFMRRQQAASIAAQGPR